MYLIILSLNPADEIFLSKEIVHLKDKFDVIFISRDRDKYDNVTIETSDGVKSYVIDDPHAGRTRWVMHLFLSLFKPEVWKDLIYLIREKSLSFITARKLLFYSASTAIDSQKIIEVLKENGIALKDKFLLYSYRMNTGALTIIKVRKHFNNAKCIARAHGVDLYEYRHEKNYLPLRRKILEELAALYCISTDGKKYVDRYQYEHCKVGVSRLGTADCGVEKIDFSDDLTHKPIIVSCSRISPEKRIEKIIDALALINDQIQWIHIGDGEAYDALKQYAHEKLDVKPNVSFDMVGNMENREVSRFYETHYIDGFVNVSSVEGIPVSIMEACSFGIPIIATNVGGTGEIVKDKYNGYLLPADFESKLLASTILSVIHNEADIFRMRQNARKEWEEHFNEERNYKLFSEELSFLFT